MFLNSSDFCEKVIPSHSHVNPNPAGINIYLHIMVTPLNVFYFYISCPRKSDIKSIILVIIRQTIIIKKLRQRDTDDRVPDNRFDTMA